MKRRDFLLQGSAAALAALFIPSLLTGCSKDKINFKDHNFSGKVLIIGAGAAGLYAAYILQENGVDVTVLEASAVIGGRIRKNDSFTNFPIDLGAEWIHGQKSLLCKWAKKMDHDTFLDNSDLLVWLDGRLQKTEPADDSELDKLMTAIEKLDNEDLSDISLQQWASNEGFNTRLDNVLEYMAGEEGTSASRLGIKAFAAANNQWSAGEKDFKFKRSFYDFINDWLIKSVQNKVEINKIVKSIDYSGAMVTVETVDSSIYSADKVIVTVPIPILKDGDIDFIPALPANKTAAIAKMSMDAGMKIAMKFSQKFWTNSVIGGEKSASYLDSGFGKDNPEHIYTAFVMGEKAEYLSSLGQGAIAELLQELDSIYNNTATSSYLDGIIMDWSQEPYIRGAYSYATVGLGDSRKILAESLADKVYFAGEATHFEGHHQTVHGAMKTAYREIEKILV